MAITASTVLQNKSNTDATSYVTAAFTPTANKLYLLTVLSGAATSGAAIVPTITTTTGLNFQQVNTARWTGSTRRVTVFRAMEASGLGNGTITIDFGANTNICCYWIVDEFDGVDTSGSDGAGAIVQSVAMDLQSAATSGSITGMAALGSSTNAVHAAWGHGANEATNIKTGWTELGEQFTNAPNQGLETQWLINDNAPTASWSTSAAWGAIGTEIKAGSQTVTHVVLTTTPSLPAARIDHSITHVVLTTTPSLPAATLSTGQTVTHVVLTTTPSLPAARVDHSLTHVVLAATPSLPAARVDHSLTHVVLTTTPSLPAASLAHSVGHVALSATPSLPTARVDHSLTHVVLTTTPSLPAATLSTADSLTHVVLTTTPSLPAARIDHSLTHVVLTASPSLPAARVDHSITHVVLTASPSLPAARIDLQITHSALTQAPSLPAAAISTADSVVHVVLTTTPSLPAARIDHTLTHVALSVTPTLPAAAITTADSITHVVLTVTPSLPAARLDLAVTHVVLSETPTLPAATVLAATDQNITHVVLDATPTLPAATITTGTIDAGPSARRRPGTMVPFDVTMAAATLGLTPYLPPAMLTVDMTPVIQRQDDEALLLDLL